MTRLLGLDVGTSSVKGIAIDGDGAVLAVAERGYPLSTPRPGWSEQDPEDWWRGAAEVLDELDAANAAGIGLSGQMHGLVALDAGGRPLRPAILWNDGRTQAQCEEIEQRIGFERLVQLTGNRALAGFTAPKLLWLAEHEPELYGRIAHILLPKDYVRLKLTDDHAIDVADASGTLLFDVADRGWSDEVVRALDVDPDVAAEGLRVAGHHRRDPWRRAGRRRRGRPGGGCARRRRRGRGRTGVRRAGHERCRLRRHGPLRARPRGARARLLPRRAAGLAHHGRDAQRGRLAAVAARDGGGTYDELLGGAAGWEPGVEGLLFAPYLAGERTPHADPGARGAFAGLGLRHDRGALARAVLEGVAFGLRDALDLVEQLGGRPRVGRISGGGARSQLWLEIVASVLEMPLEATVVDEGAAYGAALLGGVAAGVWDDVREAVSACVKVTRTIEPRPEWIAPYAEARERFRGLYPALRPLQV